MLDPKLRTATKVKPPYPLNRFPAKLPFEVGREIVYLLATSEQLALEGPTWEKIFAQAIGAKWEPSNIGLDDIRLGVCAWGAKSVKNQNPFACEKVRLISGRNNPEYSFGKIADTDDGIGRQVLDIWNARVESLRDKFSHLRTVVLVKSNDLSKFAVFEFETIMYPPENFQWRRNKQGNLVGHDSRSDAHRFTRQRHGSQFTIVEPAPQERLCFQIQLPPRVPKQEVFDAIGFDKSWIKVIRRNVRNK